MQMSDLNVEIMNMPTKRNTASFSLKGEYPVTFIFLALIAIACLSCTFVPNFSTMFFSSPTSSRGVSPFNWANPLDYVRILLHPFGMSEQAGASGFLLANLAFILFLCPTLEASFGALITIVMCLSATLVSGITAACFSPIPLTGQDAVVCMLVIASIKLSVVKRKIPFSSVALALLFSAKVGLAINEYGLLPVVSTLAGGICGSLFCFLPQEKPVSTRHKKADNADNTVNT